MPMHSCKHIKFILHAFLFVESLANNWTDVGITKSPKFIKKNHKLIYHRQTRQDRSQSYQILTLFLLSSIFIFYFSYLIFSYFYLNLLFYFVSLFFSFFFQAFLSFFAFYKFPKLQNHKEHPELSTWLLQYIIYGTKKY